MARVTLDDNKRARKHAKTTNEKFRYPGILGVVTITLGILALVSLYMELHGPVGAAAVSYTHLMKDGYRKIAVSIIIASVPAAVMGMVFKPLVYMLFSSKLAVGVFLVATGTVLWLGEYSSRSRIEPAGLTVWKSLCIGIAQGFAIAPGFSRSGATISTGLFVGLSKEDAARFSFLLSIPVILGAGLLELRDVDALGFVTGSRVPILLAFIASIVSGYLAIRLVLTVVKRRRLTIFAVYTLSLIHI